MSMPHQVHEICVGFSWAVRSQAPPPPWLEDLNSLRSRKSKVPGRVFFLPHKKKLAHHMKEEGQSLAGPERAEPVQRWHGMLPGLLNH